MEKKVTPTGCPGPLPGTKVWVCDGEQCVYGPYQYGCCKQAIAERGYRLQLSEDLAKEQALNASKEVQSLQEQLRTLDNVKQENVALLQELAQARDELAYARQVLATGEQSTSADEEGK